MPSLTFQYSQRCKNCNYKSHSRCDNRLKEKQRPYLTDQNFFQIEVIGNVSLTDIRPPGTLNPTKTENLKPGPTVNPTLTTSNLIFDNNFSSQGPLVSNTTTK